MDGTVDETGVDLAAVAEYAREAHEGQKRKGNHAPYFTHPQAVADLIRGFGGDTSVQAAGYLHDVPEDCGGEVRLNEIQSLFGERIANLVLAATDSLSADSGNKLPWKRRKDEHLAKVSELVSQGDADAALLIASDKLSNLSDLADDYERDGERAFRAFKGGSDGTRWYYRAMRDSIAPLLDERVLARLDEQLARVGA